MLSRTGQVFMENRISIEYGVVCSRVQMQVVQGHGHDGPSAIQGEDGHSFSRV